MDLWIAGLAGLSGVVQLRLCVPVALTVFFI
jgi:hypothetical protein